MTYKAVMFTDKISSRIQLPESEWALFRIEDRLRFASTVPAHDVETGVCTWKKVGVEVMLNLA
jgi:hypothetical protein